MHKTNFVIATLIGSLLACGGGGKNGGSSISRFQPSSSLAQRCTSVDTQRLWVRSNMDEVYLWYQDIREVDASRYPTPQDYFNALLVRTPSGPSGRPRDRFSFTYPTDAWNSLIRSGVEASYGIQWKIVASARDIRVAYTEPGSPAALANVRRGARVLQVNRQPVSSMPGDALSAALFPANVGIRTVFTLEELGAATTRPVELTSATVTKMPVPTVQVLDTPSGKVGYLVFNDHLATAEDPLVEAISRFKTEGITDLILDIRYNGGGYLYIAAELASMVVSDSLNGQIFEKIQFNDKRNAESSDPRYAVTFTDTTITRRRLPKLGLARLLVLTDSATCSASESVINGLTPFVNVVRIGGTTCGKPYGFLPKDNCGTSYFPIEFQGVNARNQGDYADGFTATCPALDDLSHERGDVAETMLARALSYRANGFCGASLDVAESALTEEQGELVRSPTRENRILTP